MSPARNELATLRDRREAAEILRRIVETSREPTPMQSHFCLAKRAGRPGGTRRAGVTDSARLSALYPAAESDGRISTRGAAETMATELKSPARSWRSRPTV